MKLNRILVFIVLLHSTTILLGQPKINVLKDETSGEYCCFEVEQVPSDLFAKWKKEGKKADWWKSYFIVRLSHSDQQILGKYTLQGTRLKFTPKFPLEKDVDHIVTFGKYSRTYNFSGEQTKLTTVESFYPEKIIPANALKLYITFSSPMGFDNPSDHLSLIEPNTHKIQDVFVEVKEGLWNEDRTRLTLLFHPGRIKQGVGPNVTRGPILKEGKRMVLVISGEWKDARGLELGSDRTIVRKVGPSIMDKVDPKEWNYEVNGSDIYIETGRILDKYMLDRKIFIHGPARRINGKWSVDKTRIRFTSAQGFFEADQTYELHILPTLEDISGNTLLNAFDSGEARKTVTNEPVVMKLESN